MSRSDATVGAGRALLAAAMVAVAAAGCGDGSAERAERRRALEQRKEQLVIQFVSVQNQIRQTQGRALEEPGVAALQARFYDSLRVVMIELDPGAETMLDRAREVGAEVERLSGPLLLQPGEEPPPPEERRAVGRELAELERGLRDIQSRALADPRVAGVFGELQDTLAATIIRLDPEAERTLERMQELESDVAELDRQLAAID